MLIFIKIFISYLEGGVRNPKHCRYEVKESILDLSNDTLQVSREPHPPHLRRRLQLLPGQDGDQVARPTWTGSPPSTRAASLLAIWTEGSFPARPPECSTSSRRAGWRFPARPRSWWAGVRLWARRCRSCSSGPGIAKTILKYNDGEKERRGNI